MSASLCLFLLLLPPQGTEERTLSFTIEGKVKGVLGKPGAVVKKGQVLACLDDEQVIRKTLLLETYLSPFESAEQRARMVSLQARHKLLELYLEDEHLLRPAYFLYFGLQEQYAAMKVTHAQEKQKWAKAELEKVRAKWPKHKLTAPADGVVTKVHTKLGNTVNAGEAVITIRLNKAK